MNLKLRANNGGHVFEIRNVQMDFHTYETFEAELFYFNDCLYFHEEPSKLSLSLTQVIFQTSPLMSFLDRIEAWLNLPLLQLKPENLKSELLIEHLGSTIAVNFQNPKRLISVENPVFSISVSHGESEFSSSFVTDQTCLQEFLNHNCD